MKKTEECVQLVRRHPALVTPILQTLAKERIKQENCSNSESILSGYPLQQILSSKGFKRPLSGNKSVCLTPTEYNFLYSPIKNESTYPHADEYPFTQLTKPVSCWGAHIENFQKTAPLNCGFLICEFPVDWDKVQDGSLYSQYSKRPFIPTINYQRLYQINSTFIYLFTFHSPLSIDPSSKLQKYPLKYQPTHIRGIQLIGHQFSSIVRSQNYNVETFKLIKSQLNMYMQGRNLNISLNMIKMIRSLHLKLPTPVLAYRALLLKCVEAKKLSLLSLKKGDVYEYRPTSSYQLSSWTTDLCVAQYFATQSVMRRSNPPNEISYGVIFKTWLSPSNILIDTRLLSIKDIKSIRSKSQSEIIVDRLKKKETISCQVEELWIQRKGYRLPVKRFSDLSQWMIT